MKNQEWRAGVTKAGKPPDPIAAALLSAHNLERKKEGKGPLKLSEKLSQAAATHAKDMAEHKKLDHTGTDKSSVAERVSATDYNYIVVGENIAFGQKTVEGVMATWMDSPGHRENILADFTEMGSTRRGRRGRLLLVRRPGNSDAAAQAGRGRRGARQIPQRRSKETGKGAAQSRYEAWQGRHGNQCIDGQTRHVQD